MKPHRSRLYDEEKPIEPDDSAPAWLPAVLTVAVLGFGLFLAWAGVALMLKASVVGGTAL
jgi:hypothetical protein